MNKKQYNAYAKEVEAAIINLCEEMGTACERNEEGNAAFAFNLKMTHPHVGVVNASLLTYEMQKWTRPRIRSIIIFVRCETYGNEDHRVKRTDFNPHSGKMNYICLAEGHEPEYMLTDCIYDLRNLFANKPIAIETT